MFPEIDFRVVCSKGTYIRSLANDYGKALNSGAYLTTLRRTRSGAFNIADAWNLTALIDEISVQRINWTAKETASIDESL